MSNVVPFANPDSSDDQHRDRFVVEADGVWQQGERGRRRWICSPIEVTALLRQPDQTGWSRVVSWRDPDGEQHEIVLSDAELYSDSAVVIARLVGLGLRVGEVPPKVIADYLRCCSTAQTKSCSTRTGWSAGSFVLPTRTIGDGPLYFGRAEIALSQSGDLDSWLMDVPVLIRGSDIPMFALSASFAAPLVSIAEQTSGFGFHFVGASSSGKSLCLRVAASPWGDHRQYVNSWRATTNGLEWLAESRNDLPLILDEIDQIRPEELGDAIFTICNGQGKVRASKDDRLRPAKRWRTLLLSSGEVTIGRLMTQAKRPVRVGQEIRLVGSPRW